MAFRLSDYGYVRVASISPEMRVADIDFNTEKIIEAIKKCNQIKCNFLLFPELSITGYSCADLFYQEILLNKAIEAIIKIRDFSKKFNNIIIVGLPIRTDGKIFNCAVVINKGSILGIIPKTYLCNTKEYYEERWFSSEFDRISDFISIGNEEIPFGADILFEQTSAPFATFGIEICEDLWSVKPPSLDMTINGAQLILNLSASNEYLSKPDYRRDLVRMHSAKTYSAYAFSSCGANESTTDTVFSGHCIIAENGQIFSESYRFKFDTQITISDVDINKLNIERTLNNSFAATQSDKDFRCIHYSLGATKDNKLYRTIQTHPFVPENDLKRDDICNEIFTIQATALAKRLKHINSKNVVIGISGGLDSTLALLVAIETFKILNLPLKNIHALSLPGFGTSDRTKSNAEHLAKSLKVNYKQIDIQNSVNQHFNDIGFPDNKFDVVYENAQARERTQILMDLANMKNAIVIGTGDLSEIALGWSTYNADHISMYNVNSGIPKTLVKYIIEWVAENKFRAETRKVLKDICDTPISPELLPKDKKGNIAQKTEDIIGPYELHDFFLYYVVRMHFSPLKILLLSEIAFKGKYEIVILKKYLTVFYQRFFNNQFKRSCFTDGVKVGSVSLSPRSDWRMPSDAECKLWTSEINGYKSIYG
jgi:NAD+ synthase (glutamine-hydrolysing)